VKAESGVSLYLRWSYDGVGRSELGQIWAFFRVIGVVSLSVVRKFSAPSSGNSTAPARCLRGGKRPARRQRINMPGILQHKILCIHLPSMVIRRGRVE